MANRAISLYYHAKTPTGWKRLPAVVGKNGRIRRSYGLEAGAQVHYETGSYQIRSYDGPRTIWKPIPPNADPLRELERERKRLAAREAAADAGAVIVPETGRKRLQSELNRFVQAARDRGAEVAANAYDSHGNEFLRITGRVYADEITADDMAIYARTMRRTLSDRTVSNRYKFTRGFLASLGVPKSILGRPPKYEKKLPEIYTRDELKAFFAGLSDLRERVIFETLLRAGLRERELMFLKWPNLDLENGILRVRSKPKDGFTIKDREERDVPIPQALVDLLAEWKKVAGKKKWVVGTAADKPDGHLLRLLKRIVKRHGLRCGHCDSCMEGGECENWFLHKFRATCCTIWLRAGIDLRTVQSWMGHSDIESTMRYLRPQDDADVRAKVESYIAF
jgi:integrase